MIPLHMTQLTQLDLDVKGLGGIPRLSLDRFSS